MDISDILKISWDDVTRSGVPEHLHEIAFREAVRLRSGSPSASNNRPLRPTTSQFSGSGSSRVGTGEEGNGDSFDVDAAYAILSDEAGLSEDEIREVLLFTDDGQVEVLAPGRKLGRNTSEKARNVAILIVGARFGVLKQRTVPIDVVRDQCVARGCYDSKNFKSAHLGKFDAVNIRNNDLLINPSKWLPAFKAAVNTARGVSSAAE